MLPHVRTLHTESLLPPDDALREWVVSTRVNRAGAGDDDPELIKPIEHA